MAKWFITDNKGRKKGSPLEISALKKKAEAGKITPDTMLISEAGSSRRAGSMKSLFPAVQAEKEEAKEKAAANNDKELEPRPWRRCRGILGFSYEIPDSYKISDIFWEKRLKEKDEIKQIAFDAHCDIEDLLKDLDDLVTCSENRNYRLELPSEAFQYYYTSLLLKVAFADSRFTEDEADLLCDICHPYALDHLYKMVYGESNTHYRLPFLSSRPVSLRNFLVKESDSFHKFLADNEKHLDTYIKNFIDTCKQSESRKVGRILKDIVYNMILTFFALSYIDGDASPGEEKVIEEMIPKDIFHPLKVGDRRRLSFETNPAREAESKGVPQKK